GLVTPEGRAEQLRRPERAVRSWVAGHDRVRQVVAWAGSVGFASYVNTGGRGEDTLFVNMGERRRGGLDRLAFPDEPRRGLIDQVTADYGEGLTADFG